MTFHRRLRKTHLPQVLFGHNADSNARSATGNPLSNLNIALRHFEVTRSWFPVRIPYLVLSAFVMQMSSECLSLIGYRPQRRSQPRTPQELLKHVAYMSHIREGISREYVIVNLFLTTHTAYKRETLAWDYQIDEVQCRPLEVKCDYFILKKMIASRATIWTTCCSPSAFLIAFCDRAIGNFEPCIEMEKVWMEWFYLRWLIF